MCEVYSIMLIFLCAVVCQFMMFQVGHDTGSTDVLMVFDQVSWQTKLMFRFRRLVR